MRRIVAYIYHYKKEEGILQRCNNTGFCRVELGCESENVTVCLKDGCGVEGTARIYVLKEIGEKNYVEKTYNKIKLDKSGIACEGVLNIKLCVCNSDGIYVECGGRIYAALWKDGYDKIRVIEPEKFEEATVKKHEEEHEGENKDKVQDKIQDKIQEKNQDENVKEKKKNMEYSQLKQKKESQQRLEEFTRIYNRLCKIRIILDGTEYPAVKLRPYELMFLPRSCWRMANNVFLMESYYRYGHILFMQYDDSYVLAVPWKKGRNTENQAKQFGFTKCLTGYEYGKSKEEKYYFLKYL